jgi:hypothetical protein
VLRELWNRLVRRSREASIDREVELEQMGPEERRFAEESIEDLQSEEFAGAQLGGIDPERLLGDGRPPSRDDVPPD